MIKKRALVIAPYQGLTELIRNLEVELLDFEIIVHVADLVESLNLLKVYQDDPFDFIISRGGTADLLKNSTKIPVVEIEVSGYDILRILTLLKGYNQKIEIIGFKNVVQGFESISKLIEIDMTYTVVNRKEEVEPALKRAKKNGAKIIVGDTITVRLANEMDLQGVLITSGKESILEAFYKARQMYKVLAQQIAKTTFYQQVINKLDSGIVIVSENGIVRFANAAIADILHIKQETNVSIFETHPYFRKIIENTKNEISFQYQLTRDDIEALYNITSESMDQIDQESLFFFEISRSNKVSQQEDIQIIFPHKNVAYPQLVMSGNLFDKALEIAKQQMKSSLPIIVVGEKGSGKRLLVNTLYRSLKHHDGSLIEIEINRSNTKSFNQILKMLEQEGEHSLIHIRGLENTSLPQQQKLFQRLDAMRAQLVFSFIGSRNVFLNNERKLEPRLFEAITSKPIYFPPLRERMDELNEMIQTFIVQYNEVYGKQVVGVRPNVLEAMQAHPWKENLMELKRLIEGFVKHSDDEYISEDVLIELQGESRTNPSISDSTRTFINLDQPLENIEAEVIQLVMEQENMNQSRAAKRLGINRSTLWRKLKQE
ncbi:sigma-54-dependent Fis family transcriptional regulator [Sutcliffiella deserti]|uniref:sigma-54-dependent Fis family transcriptional regulator n=1 Tax=Sutcliffiella deserti TaxID=2875501 RepID=UPI001CC02BEB|nr:PrpR N-terminal domain-containing protein [Sutcliffiella deserti]